MGFILGIDLLNRFMKKFSQKFGALKIYIEVLFWGVYKGVENIVDFSIFTIIPPPKKIYKFDIFFILRSKYHA